MDGKDYDWNTPIAGDMTLTASWKKHEEPKPVTHTVSFYTDGGNTVAQQTVNDGETVTVPDTPTKNGYTFSGWTLNGEPYDFNLPVTADITLKATWVENQKPQPKRHTVTFDTTGGSEIGQQTVDEGEKAIQPANPTREGYDFQGWLLNGQAYNWNTQSPATSPSPHRGRRKPRPYSRSRSIRAALPTSHLKKSRKVIRPHVRPTRSVPDTLSPDGS